MPLDERGPKPASNLTLEHMVASNLTLGAKSPQNDLFSFLAQTDHPAARPMESDPLGGDTRYGGVRNGRGD